MYFLLVYDRMRNLLLHEQQFESHREALRARFRAEGNYSSDETEVVVVGAESRGELLKSHGRYFLSLRQLADRAEETLA